MRENRRLLSLFLFQKWTTVYENIPFVRYLFVLLKSKPITDKYFKFFRILFPTEGPVVPSMSSERHPHCKLHSGLTTSFRTGPLVNLSSQGVSLVVSALRTRFYIIEHNITPRFFGWPDPIFPLSTSQSPLAPVPGLYSWPLFNRRYGSYDPPVLCECLNLCCEKLDVEFSVETNKVGKWIQRSPFV